MKTARQRRQQNSTTCTNILSMIDAKMEEAVQQGESKIFLYFDQFGYEWEDVNFLSELYGYAIHRNGACLWWEVSW